jgi:hypothetical protein
LFPFLPLVSTTPAKLVAKFAAGVVDAGGKFAAGVVHNGSNFAACVIDTGGHQCCLYWRFTLTWEYLCEFSKKF